MKAIEINSRTDKAGHLKIDYKLDKPEKNVRVLILVEDTDDDEQIWMESISKNPAFDFLSDSAEDVYSVKDGDPIDD